jgi:hypothetical protein
MLKSEAKHDKTTFETTPKKKEARLPLEIFSKIFTISA